MKLAGNIKDTTLSFDSLLHADYDKLSAFYAIIEKTTDSLEQMKDTPANCIKISSTAVKKALSNFKSSVHTPDCSILSDSLDMAFLDFKTRVQLLKDNGRLFPDSTGVAVLYQDQFITSHEQEMRDFINVLKANQNAKDTVASRPYSPNKADYLDVSFTIYGHKFAKTKDTLLTQTLRFLSRSVYQSGRISRGLLY